MQQQKDILESAVAGVGSGLAGLVGNALGRSGDFLITAYENGLLRIQIELQFLNFSVAVAYPLVEFFVRHRNITEVRCDLDFVTEIIWTKESREAQLRNVVTAAFGPISILLKSQSGEDEEASGGQPPTSG